MTVTSERSRSSFLIQDFLGLVVTLSSSITGLSHYCSGLIGANIIQCTAGTRNDGTLVELFSLVLHQMHQLLLCQSVAYVTTWLSRAVHYRCVLTKFLGCLTLA